MSGGRDRRHGIYVHVPWCRVRCPYCAFAVEPGAGVPQWRPYVARVLAERDLRAAEFPEPPATLYFGGGTPSRLPPEAIAALIAGLLPRGLGEIEITAEANPEDLDGGWLEEAIAAGVTRVSLGVQSTVAAVARRLGRGHTQARSEAAMARAAGSGLRSWSVDLMFAVPGQSIADLDRDIDAILGAGAPHVSLYGLTLEPGTRFGRASERGRGGVSAPDDELWRQMYDRLVERLGAAGIARYEVSNFAREGHRSEHNSGYWSDRPYLGLGPSAHGYAPDGSRWVNHAELARYLAADDPTADRERPLGVERAIDRLVSGMRAVEGVDLAELAEVTGVCPRRATTDTLVAGGLLRRDGARIALSEAAFPIADAVIGRLAEALKSV